MENEIKFIDLSKSTQENIGLEFRIFFDTVTSDNAYKYFALYKYGIDTLTGMFHEESWTFSEAYPEKYERNKLFLFSNMIALYEINDDLTVTLVAKSKLY